MLIHWPFAAKCLAGGQKNCKNIKSYSQQQKNKRKEKQMKSARPEKNSLAGDHNRIIFAINIRQKKNNQYKNEFYDFIIISF